MVKFNNGAGLHEQPRRLGRMSGSAVGIPFL